MSWIWHHISTWFISLVIKIVRIGYIPRHVAFIMDGNRRYASKKHVTKEEGYTQGSNKLLETVDWCSDLGICEITMYAFSIENFKRSKEEVDLLIKIIKQQIDDLTNNREKVMRLGICFRTIGNLSLLPEDLCKSISKLTIVTKNNNKLFLNMALAYTSRDEITYAIKNIIKGVKHNEMLLEDINEDLISKCLYTYNSSNPNLLIRTSGETRLSDFLMWQMSNTCLYFSDVMWPEFKKWHFFCAIMYYQKCYPDLKKYAGMQNLNPITDNDRVSTYVNKLHHERQIMLENLCPPAVES